MTQLWFKMQIKPFNSVQNAITKHVVIEDPALRRLFPSIDPDQLVQLVLKICTVHLERSTDDLIPIVGQKTVDYLNPICGFSNPTDIENWHQFCKTHENKKLLVSSQGRVSVAASEIQQEPVQIPERLLAAIAQPH
ncbi:hypothetical protein B0H14DRAFT_3424201 [Mycena olivaceomarginata]|nr:hypothetical protein B0H14DRAFT_3424201 [Mycena olivaceomarginata]